MTRISKCEKEHNDRAACTHNLRHVQNDNGGLETDTDTGNKTTGDDSSEGVAGASDHLDDHTEHVDSAAIDDSPLAAEMVGEIAGNEGTEEGSAGENRDDERGVRGRDLLGAGELDGILEDLRAEDSVDVAGVVAEEDATERGKGADHVRLPGDGGLDAVDVLRGGNAVNVVGGRGLRFLFMEGVSHRVCWGPLSAAQDSRGGRVPGADGDVGRLEKMLERHKRAKTADRTGGRALFNEKWEWTVGRPFRVSPAVFQVLETRWTRTASADRPFTGSALGRGRSWGTHPSPSLGSGTYFAVVPPAGVACMAKSGPPCGHNDAKMMAAGPTRDGRSMQHGLK